MERHVSSTDPAQLGMTLVEMSIALLAFGVAAWLLVDPLAALIQTGKRGAAQTTLAAAKDRIIGYALAHQALPAAPEPLSDPWNGPVQYLVFGTGNICAGGIGLGHASLFTVENADGSVTPNVALLLWSNGPNHRQDLVYDAQSRTLRVATAKDDLFTFVTFSALYKLVCQPTAAAGGRRPLLALRPQRGHAGFGR